MQSVVRLRGRYSLWRLYAPSPDRGRGFADQAVLHLSSGSTRVRQRLPQRRGVRRAWRVSGGRQGRVSGARAVWI